MIRKIILMTIFFIVPNVNYSKLLEKYVINNVKTEIFKDMFSKESAGFVPYALPFSPMDRKGSMIQLRFNNSDVWIHETNATLLDFKFFSEENSRFLSISEFNGSFFFIYNNNLYSMPIKNNPENKINKLAKMPNLIGATASSDATKLLLIGANNREEKPSANLAFFDIKAQNFIPLTSFIGDFAKIDIIEFSNSGKYVAILLTISEERFIYVFNVKNQSLSFSRRGITGFSWQKESLLIYHPTKTEQLLENREVTVLANHKKIPIPKKVEDQLFIEIDDVIYEYVNKKLEKTKHKALERSPEGLLQQQDINNSITTTYKGKTLRSFSGKNPRRTVISFLGDHHILYSEKQGAFSSLFLYDAEADKSKKYRWVEDILVNLKDGTIIDAVIEGEEIWLFIEEPEGLAKIVRLHELL